MTLRQKTNGAHKSLFPLRPVLVSDRDVLGEQIFHRMISLKRKRTSTPRWLRTTPGDNLDVAANCPGELNLDHSAIKPFRISAAQTNTRRNTDDGHVVGHIGQNNAIGPHYNIIPNPCVADEFGARAEIDVIANSFRPTGNEDSRSHREVRASSRGA